MRGGLTAAQLTYLQFEPSLGITAARINKLGADINDFKDILRKCIREVVIPSIQTNFTSGGRPPWPPRSQETIEFRAMMGEDIGPSVMIRSGALMGAMNDIGLWTITDDFAILTDIPDSVWYGKVHQAGFGGKTSSAGKHEIAAIPARPFVMFQPEDEDRILELFEEWLGEKIQRAWPGGVNV
jgi:phage gpG-like protein